MKRLLTLALCITLATFGCKKGNKEGADESLEKKYSKSNTCVYETAELKKCLTTLSKAEPVDLLDLQTDPKSKKETARVRLSDDTIGFIAAGNLADKPIVFLEDTKAHMRNNIGSKVFETIPKGTIGFIIDEKADWVKVYIGQVGAKWVTQHWVQGGYSTDPKLVLDARTYEDAMSVLKKPDAKPEDTEKARKSLEELSNAGTIFGELARHALNPIEGAGPTEQNAQPADQSSSESQTE